MGGYRGEGNELLKAGILDGIVYGPERVLPAGGGDGEDGGDDGNGPWENFYDRMTMEELRKSSAQLGYHVSGGTKWSNAQLHTVGKRYAFEKKAIGDAMFPENIVGGRRTATWYSRMANIVRRFANMGIELT